MDEVHALLEGLQVTGLIEVLQRDVEVIDDGQQLGEHLLSTVADELALFLERALAEVVVLGYQAQMRILEALQLLL